MAIASTYTSALDLYKSGLAQFVCSWKLEWKKFKRKCTWWSVFFSFKRISKTVSLPPRIYPSSCDVQPAVCTCKLTFYSCRNFKTFLWTLLSRKQSLASLHERLVEVIKSSDQTWDKCLNTHARTPTRTHTHPHTHTRPAPKQVLGTSRPWENRRQPVVPIGALTHWGASPSSRLLSSGEGEGEKEVGEVGVKEGEGGGGKTWGLRVLRPPRGEVSPPIVAIPSLFPNWSIRERPGANSPQLNRRGAGALLPEPARRQEKE